MIGGLFSTCVVRGDGAFCTGRGLAVLDPSGESAHTVAFRGATSIGCGQNACCAASEDGSVRCWGYHYGASSGTVPFGEPIADVAPGNRESCALTADGEVCCWTDGPRASASIACFRFLARVIAIGSTGYDDWCALEATGAVMCWGSNVWMHLGDGGGTRSDLPVRALLTEPATALAMSGHTCAVGRAGTVWCWGGNSRGQLGRGYADELIHRRGGMPRRVATRLRFAAIAAGGAFTCGLTAEHDVWCWGDNTYGQCGHRAPRVALEPRRVLHLDDAVGVAAGGYHACVWSAARVFCWGRGDQGALGSGRCTESRCAPVELDLGELENAPPAPDPIRLPASDESPSGSPS